MITAGRHLAAVVVLVSLPTVLPAQDCTGIAPVNNTDLKSVVVASGLNVPVLVTSPPGDPDRIFIVQQDGVIRLKRRGDPPAATSVFIDLTDRVYFDFTANEAGLLGLAFDPGFATNGFFYVNYNEGTGFFCGSCQTVVSRFSLLSPDQGDPASEVQLMRFPQPQSNHNGGLLEFGPDGMLYVYQGDGGGANDTGTGHAACGNAQSLTTLLGKILRIDVSGGASGNDPDSGCMTGFAGAGYKVPTDNPFANGPGGTCDEIWAYGLRNPWRNSFDPATGDHYVADVGQNCFEEVNFVTAGSGGGLNFGWNYKEADACFNPASPTDCSVPPPGPGCGGEDCTSQSYVDPVKVYGNPAEGDSVIGGHVYRGCRMPGFDGTYFYGDNGSGFIRSFEVVAGVVTNELPWTTNLGGPFANGLTSFGVDGLGELYFADAAAGVVRKILPPFTDLEVSGTGAADRFRVNRSGNWTWEDVERTTMHPVDYYQVYRGVPDGTFTCIHATRSAGWPAGDATDPSAGQLLAYLVTAVSPVSEGAEESSSGDPPRTLTSPCAPPP